MTGRTITRYVLECDGCDATIGSDATFDNATEARCEAYAQGWRFPPALNPQGKTSKRLSDACPKCINGWTAKPDGHAREIARRRGN